ncbi:MAG: MATE family efflux transporter [Planctomycetales bacterium]
MREPQGVSSSTVTSRLTEQTGVFRPLMVLVAPVLAEQCLHLLVAYSDHVLTGWYFGAPHLAAVGSMSYLLWLLVVLFSFVATGATALTARFAGEDDFDQAQLATNQAFLLGTISCIPLTVLGFLSVHPIAATLGLQGDAAGLAARYLQYVFLVLPMIMVEAVGIACLRGVGDTRAGLWIMGAVNVVNVTVSWSLVQGWGPFPRLGWDGVPLGTACGHLVGGLMVLAFLLKGRSGLRLRWKFLKPDPVMIRRVLRIGIPGGVDGLSVVFCQLWFLAIINSLGNVAAAAHGVAIKIEALAYLPGTAFQVAAATLAGVYLGAKDEQRAARAVGAACAWGAGTMTLAAIVFFVFGESLASMMVVQDTAGKTEVVEVAGLLLRIVAVSVPALGLQMILCGALRGAGDTRFTMIISWVGFLTIRIPLAYIAVHYLGWGVVGAWYAMCLDIFARCLLSVIRYRHGGWTRLKV